jgi:hypothetical protein
MYVQLASMDAAAGNAVTQTYVLFENDRFPNIRTLGSVHPDMPSDDLDFATVLLRFEAYLLQNTQVTTVYDKDRKLHGAAVMNRTEAQRVIGEELHALEHILAERHGIVNVRKFVNGQERIQPSSLLLN